MAERHPARNPRREEDRHPVPGSSEDFVPQTTTDVAQHAPGPHGQGDEPTSAPAGRSNYDESDVPKVRKASTPKR
jgi:hypothetical protein